MLLIYCECTACNSKELEDTYSISILGNSTIILFPTEKDGHEFVINKQDKAALAHLLLESL